MLIITLLHTLISIRIFLVGLKYIKNNAIKKVVFKLLKLVLAFFVNLKVLVLIFFTMLLSKLVSFVATYK